MTDTVLKAVKLKKSSTEHEGTLPQPKRPRTAEDFLLFCRYILDYVNYDETNTEEVVVEKTENSIRDDESSPNSVKSESAISSATEDDRKSSDTDSDEDSFDLVTCYCTKPFAGRPMIECSKCLTWVHLSCAKVRKSNIPDVFVCAKCKEIQMTALSQALRLRSEWT